MAVMDTHLSMVLSCHALTNSRLHEPGQGRQHVNGRVDTAVVQLTLDIYLALSNVASKIGDGMGDIIVGHGENGELCDGAWAAHNTPRTLVDGRQIRVHIAGVTTASRHLHDSVHGCCDRTPVESYRQYTGAGCSTHANKLEGSTLFSGQTVHVSLTRGKRGHRPKGFNVQGVKSQKDSLAAGA